MTTMLALVQQAAGEIGINVPATVAGNTAQDVTQLLSLLNACGYELKRRYPWQALTKAYKFYMNSITTTGTRTTSAYTITGIPSTTGINANFMASGTGIPQNALVVSNDSATQVTLDSLPTSAATSAAVIFYQVKYALPSDFDGAIPRTNWDKAQHWEMVGPVDAQQWEWLLSGYISTGPRIRWRLLGGQFQIWPGLTSADQLGFEYRSNAWATSSGGTAKTSFTLDTDTCIYPDRLIVTMLKLKYFEAKGFDTTAMMRNFMEEFEAAQSLDMSSANLSFAPRPGNILIGYDNIPDSGYGV